MQNNHTSTALIILYNEKSLIRFHFRFYCNRIMLRIKSTCFILSAHLQLPILIDLLTKCYCCRSCFIIFLKDQLSILFIFIPLTEDLRENLGETKNIRGSFLWMLDTAWKFSVIYKEDYALELTYSLLMAQLPKLMINHSIKYEWMRKLYQGSEIVQNRVYKFFSHHTGWLRKNDHILPFWWTFAYSGSSIQYYFDASTNKSDLYISRDT